MSPCPEIDQSTRCCEVTGLDYFGARYFSGAQGRFTSPDAPFADQNPADPQSWNLYAYGRNNPLRYTDPTGRKCVQTSNGPADDGTGGGCKGAGVDENGNITPQQVTVGVGRDEANLIMLQRVGEQLSSPHEQAEVISNGMQGAMAVEGIRSIPSLFRAGISLWKNWRTISSLYGVLDHLLFG
jgi:RHS repeat-associated protein